MGKTPADRHRAPSAPIRVGGLAAMRALAHPTRVRIFQLLHSEPMSASEIARRLDIRFGSARFHLGLLERAGIARKVGERRKRGGVEILFEVPPDLWVDMAPDAPVSLRQAMTRAYLAEIQRRMDAEAAEPEPQDTDRDALVIREIELDADDVAAAAEALHDFVERLTALGSPRPTAHSRPFTASVQLFRIPRSASQHPDGPRSAG